MSNPDFIIPPPILSPLSTSPLWKKRKNAYHKRHPNDIIEPENKKSNNTSNNYSSIFKLACIICVTLILYSWTH